MHYCDIGFWDVWVCGGSRWWWRPWWWIGDCRRFILCWHFILYWPGIAISRWCIIVTHWFRSAILCGFRIIEFHCFSINWTCVSNTHHFFSTHLEMLPSNFDGPFHTRRISYVSSPKSPSIALRRLCVRVWIFWQQTLWNNMSLFSIWMRTAHATVCH